MASYTESARSIAEAISDVSMDIERLQQSILDGTCRGTYGSTISHRPQQFVPETPGLSTRNETSRRKKSHSSRRHRQKIMDDLRTQWRATCSETDSEGEHRPDFSCPRSPTSSTQARNGDEPRCAGRHTAVHTDTAASGSSAVNAGGQCANVERAGVALRVKAREYDGSSCIEDYLVHFERVSAINSWDDRQRADYLMVALKAQHWRWPAPARRRHSCPMVNW